MKVYEIKLTISVTEFFYETIDDLKLYWQRQKTSFASFV